MGTLALPDARLDRHLDGGVLIAGLGSVGRRHLQNLRALGVTEVAAYRTGTGRLVPRGREDVEVFDDLERALARRPAAVVVANPTALHVPTALRAVQAGAHVLLEKPVSDSLEGIEELGREASARGRVVLVGYQLRFHPTLLKLREWLALGAIGPLVCARAHWGECVRNWHPWEDYRTSYSTRRDLGGGALPTISHPFDYLRWICGEVVSVSAESGQLGGLALDVEDCAQVTLRFATGGIGSVWLDYVQSPAQHRLVLIGQRGRIVWDGASGLAQLEVRGGRPPIAAYPPVGFERNWLFAEELRHFLACIAGAETPRCTLDDGIRALRIALAARASSLEGRRIDV
jgi:predicted dehydrogenase